MPGRRSRPGAANTTRNGRIVRSATSHRKREDRAEFHGLLEGLRTHYNPVGPYEDLLVQEIAVAKWKVIRLERYEAAGVSVRLSEAIAAGQDRIEEERWGIVQKDLRFKLYSLEDPANKPVVTAAMLREQIDLVKRLNRDDAAIGEEPVFRAFVWLEKTGGDPDGTIPDEEREEKCRAILAALSDTEMEDSGSNSLRTCPPT